MDLLIGLLGALLGAAVMWAIHRRQDARRERDATLQAQRERIEAERKREQFARFDITDTNNQLRFLGEASIHTRKPINKEAFKTVFAVAERTLAKMGGRYRLLSEVSMGSFLGTSRQQGSQGAQDRAFSSINSKRVDFLVIDRFGEPRLVIEYQGTGHYQGNAAARDAVKRKALERAGLPLLEIHEGASPAEVDNKVRCWLRNN